VPSCRFRASRPAGQSRTIAIVRDITTEAELRERLALLTLIADGTNRAVVVTIEGLKTLYPTPRLRECLDTRSRKRRGGR